MTDEQSKEFEKVTRPVIEWLNNNSHPHTIIIIQPTGAEVLEGVLVFNTTDYVND